MTDDEIPEQITERYAVRSLLGQGSFGRTYLASDRQREGRLVAIKQLRAEGEEGWKRHELFEREVAVLGALRHHGIPEVYEQLRVPRARGEDVYLVMEYIEGESLAAIAGRGAPMDPARLLTLLLGLLEILDYLHTRAPPVLHRDIKPANVIVRPGGSPALVDFGAVRNVFKRPDEGGSTVVGTHGYMPFEQYMGQASPASDLYAVGATFLHLLTGRSPAEFVGEGGRIEVPADLPGGPLLGGVITRLLAPAASDRYASARATRDALLGGVAEPGSRALVPATVSSSLAPLLDPQQRDRRLRELAVGPVRVMFPNLRPSDPVPAAYMLGFVLLAAISFGLTLFIAYVQAKQREGRLRYFFREGRPALARLLGNDGRGVWTYEFVVDGVPRRGADAPLPSIARRWHPGDTVQVLYVPGGDYDSAIVETA